jgi:hypothetical protein
MFGHPCDGISGGIIPILFCFRSNERETLWVLFIDFILVESQRTGAACHTRKVTWLLLSRTSSAGFSNRGFETKQRLGPDRRPQIQSTTSLLFELARSAHGGI